MLCRPKKRLDKLYVAQAPRIRKVCKSAEFLRHSAQDLRSHRGNNGQVPRTNSASTSCPVRATRTQSYPFSTKDVSGVWVACAGQRVYSNNVHEFWLCMSYCRRTQCSDRPDRGRKNPSTKATTTSIAASIKTGYEVMQVKTVLGQQNL